MSEQLINYRSFVGLDVHARTIVGGAIDDQTGEVVRRRFGHDLAEVLAWVDSLPSPQKAKPPVRIVHCCELAHGCFGEVAAVSGFPFGVNISGLGNSVTL